MKKTKMIRIIIAGICATLCATGCSKNNGGSSEPSTSQNPNVVEFLDFEEFDPDFQLLRLMNNFGKISVNSDANYVKGGNQSAKLQPLGSYANQNSNPYLYFELKSERFNYSYVDLTYLYSMTLWIYNASIEQKEMEVGVVTSFMGIQGGTTQDGGMTYYLNNGWNKVTYFVDKEAIYVPNGGSEVTGLYLQFENMKSLNLSDAPVFYVDDVSLTIKPDDRDIVLERADIKNYVQGETVVVPKATIEGGEVSFTVYCGDSIITSDKNSFVATEGGFYRIAYKATVNNFVYRKYIKIFVKPTNSVDVVNLSTREGMNNLSPRTSVIESMDWLNEFEGQKGVAKFVINRDWPSFNFTSQNPISSFIGCQYIALRMYVPSGDNTLTLIRLNDAATPLQYEGHLTLNQWDVYLFPIQSFLTNFNESFFVGNSTSYIYFGSFYISEIFAI